MKMKWFRKRPKRLAHTTSICQIKQSRDWGFDYFKREGVVDDLTLSQEIFNLIWQLQDIDEESYHRCLLTGEHR